MNGDLRRRTADAILAEMDAQDVTRAELARRMGQKKAGMTRLLSGEGNLTLDSLSQIGDALSTDVVVVLKRRPGGRRASGSR